MGSEVAVIPREGDGPGTALAPRDQVGGLIRPVAPPEEVLQAQEETRKLVAATLKPGRDYGVIPGTGDKPTMLKPGAERICTAFGCFPRYRIIEREVDHDRTVEWTKRRKEWSGPKGKRTFRWVTENGTSIGLYRYVLECELVHRGSGTVIGQGIASCSTMESKYVDRPRDSENTALKMAEKRAFVAATLNTFGLSDQFTQDLEEAVEEETAPDPATTDQIDAIRSLLKAANVTDAERAKTEAAIERGMTAERADAAIAWLRKNQPTAEEVVAQEVEEQEAELPFPGEPLNDATPEQRDELAARARSEHLTDEEKADIEEALAGALSKAAADALLAHVAQTLGERRRGRAKATASA